LPFYGFLLNQNADGGNALPGRGDFSSAEIQAQFYINSFYKSNGFDIIKKGGRRKVRLSSVPLFSVLCFGKLIMKQIKIKIGEGEKLVASLEKRLAEMGVKEAVIVSCVGALMDFDLVTIRQDSDKIPPDHYQKHFDMKAELLGNGSVTDGAAHLHVVCGLDGGKAAAGHLVEGTVTYFAQIILLTEV